jgi:hypothetical protein
MTITVDRCDGQPNLGFKTARDAFKAIREEYPDALLWDEGRGCAIRDADQLWHTLLDHETGRILVWPTVVSSIGDDGSNAFAEVRIARSSNALR